MGAMLGAQGAWLTCTQALTLVESAFLPGADRHTVKMVLKRLKAGAGRSQRTPQQALSALGPRKVSQQHAVSICMQPSGAIVMLAWAGNPIDVGEIQLALRVVTGSNARPVGMPRQASLQGAVLCCCNNWE